MDYDAMMLHDTIAAVLDETLPSIAQRFPFTIRIVPYTKKHTPLIAVEIHGALGRYRFDTIPHASLSANGSLQVHETWRGRGIGGALVAARELSCGQSGIETIVIGENGNDPFWWSRGYEPVQDASYYRTLAREGVIRYRGKHEGFGTPLMKRL